MKNLQSTMIINGQTVDLLNLEPRQVSMPKMVKGLQGVIRFNGYSSWSVAQHSLLLSFIVGHVTGHLIRQGLSLDGAKQYFGEQVLERYHVHTQADLNDARVIALLQAEMAYDALIHDFSESLTGDIIRPFKKLVPAIGEMERKIDSQLRQIHGGLSEMPLLVDILDKQLATIEAYFLTRFHGKTLLNELDDFHIRSFNSTFTNNAETQFIMSKMGINVKIDEPISDRDLHHFLRFSSVGFSEIKNATDELLLDNYIDRAVRLKNAKGA